MTSEIVKQDSKEIKPIDINNAPELQAPEEGDTLRIPRLAMIQEKHKAIKEGWAKPGELVNTLTKDSYGKSIELVAVYQRPLTRIRWAPRNAGGSMLCISRNKAKPSGDPGNDIADCAACPYVKDNNPDTGCTMNYEIVALVIQGDNPRFWEPILLTAEYTRPSDQGVRNILENARYNMRRGIRMFHKPYILSVVEAKNKFGEFYKTACSPGTFGGKTNNGLLPIDVIDYLEEQVKFFSQAVIDTAEPATETADVEVDSKTGAPAGW